jgi:CTP:molybdopterin cytidylyltransferase MocA
MIAAVILAAGSGTRMGGPKALLVLGGETLLQRAVREAREAGCAPVLAVVGTWEPGPLGRDIRVIRNMEAGEGVASSIRAGITALPPEATSVLLLTVDQPAVDVPLLRALLSLARTDPSRPTACAYAGTLGIPAILPRRLFGDLMTLRGDRGAKAILLREAAASLPFPKGEADLDTPADLEPFKR